MNALKKVGALFLASVMIFSMAGCKKKSKSQDGAKSAEELVTKIVDAINGDIKYSKVEKWIDWYGWIAYYMIDQTRIDCDFLVLRDAVEDLDKGVDYLKKHHKEFAEAWEEATGNSLKKKDLREYLEFKGDIDELLESGDDEILEQFRKFAPYELEFDEDNIHERDEYDIGYYSIKIDDEYYRSLEIHYYINDDGKYVCYGINYVV